jgi:chromosomal replication initiator protein
MITIASIQAAACRRYGLRSADMTSPERTWRVSHPRQVAMYLSRRFTPRTLPEIGQRFGGRHHTTVMHALSAVEQRRAGNRRLERDIRRIMARAAVAPHPGGS